MSIKKRIPARSRRYLQPTPETFGQGINTDDVGLVLRSRVTSWLALEKDGSFHDYINSRIYSPGSEPMISSLICT